MVGVDLYTFCLAVKKFDSKVNSSTEIGLHLHVYANSTDSKKIGRWL